MTILHLDGFDGASDLTDIASEVDTAAYLQARYATPTFNADGPVVFTGWGGSGKSLAFGVSTGADANYIRASIPETQTTIIGFAFRPENGLNLALAKQFVRFRHVADGRQHVTVHLIQGRHLKFTRGTTTFLGSVLNAANLGRWTYLEFKVKIDNSVGTIDCQVNGVNVLSLTGLDTQDAGSADIDTIELVGIDGTNNGEDGACLFDDFYISDVAGSSPVNDFLGPTKIEELLPGGAGDSTNWTPSAGSNFQNVDETPRDDDTTYNTSLTPADLDLFTAGNLAKIDGTVYGVQLDVLARVTEAGAFTIVPTVKSSTTEGADGGTSIVNTSYLAVKGLFELDPNAAAPWTPTTVNAMQIGYEVG